MKKKKPFCWFRTFRGLPVDPILQEETSSQTGKRLRIQRDSKKPEQAPLHCSSPEQIERIREGFPFGKSSLTQFWIFLLLVKVGGDSHTMGGGDRGRGSKLSVTRHKRRNHWAGKKTTPGEHSWPERRRKRDKTEKAPKGKKERSVKLKGSEKKDDHSKERLWA